MIDPDLIAKKLAFIETCIAELQNGARVENIDRDVRERRFIEHTLQLAIQAALDVASHIISSKRLGEPRTNRELFDILNVHDWISNETSARLRNMAGFRNVLVHGYTEVDLVVVRDVVEHRLSDLEEYVFTIRERLGLE